MREALHTEVGNPEKKKKKRLKFIKIYTPIVFYTSYMCLPTYKYTVNMVWNI